MKNMFLKPWIGKNYEKGFGGQKLLVLGMSHYAKQEEWNEDFTNHIMRDCYLNPEYERGGWTNTYTKFERTLAGRELTWAEKEDVWNSLMFWNFIQEPMPDKDKQPSGEQVAVGQKAFVEILETYRPDKIIVWSKDLFHYLPEAGGRPGKDVGGNAKTWIYPLPGGGECVAMQVDHPSSGFPRDYWHELISEFLNS